MSDPAASVPGVTIERASTACRPGAGAARPIRHRRAPRQPERRTSATSADTARRSGSAAAPSAASGARSSRPPPRPVALRTGRRPPAGRAGPTDRHDQRRAGPGPADRRAPSSTGCSAAAWCPARSCCSPASPASASRPCCSTSPSSGRPAPADAGPALVVSGEESASQVRLRAERHRRPARAALPGRRDRPRRGARPPRRRSSPGCWCSTRCRPFSAPGADGVAGGVTQVRAVTAALVAVAKERGIATVLVGHVTKDGQVAGPRVLEHLVDVVLQFEGDKHSSLRLVRGLKNRFGAADEVGCFEMHEGGITSLPDPSGLFLTRYAEPVPAPASRWRWRAGGPWSPRCRRWSARPWPARRGAPSAGWTAPGWPWCSPCCSAASGLRLHDREVFAATVGGIRVVEPAADLGAGARGRLGRARPAARRRPGRDRRGRADRRDPPGRRGAPAAGRGGPARLPLRAGAARAAARPRPARPAPACGCSRSPTVGPRCDCGGASADAWPRLPTT